MGYNGPPDLVPYTPNRYTRILGTWKDRFAPNFILRLAYHLLITLPKFILIGPQGPVLHIVLKSVYWVIGIIERPIRTKFDI